ncbi:MAG TPA: amidohydrolase family protein [Terriglobales bacterium]|jgi:uncharacterized protein|nr:amidohydrolase family protein [Terriglobales bacterium]
MWRSHRICLMLLVGTILAETGTKPIVPFADYHQHLFSPAKAAALYDPPLPAVPLPADLTSLIKARERAQNDESQLATLYAHDAMMLNTQDTDAPSWIRGNQAVAKEAAIYFDEPYRITPVSYQIDGSSAFIAGYYTAIKDKSPRHLAHLFLSLKKEDGSWRIVTELPGFPGPPHRDPSTADQLIRQLDDAGIQKAVVLSVAYQWGSDEGCPACTPEQEYAKVKAENDYIAAQVGRYPNRLVGFCSFNPLKTYALEELNRCSKLPGMRGLKLHFGNSRVDIRNPEHLEKVRAVFRAANQLKIPMVVHLWTDPAYEKEGAQHAQIFLDRLLPDAPDVTIQIAHLAGGGRATPSALAVFANAIAKSDPRTKHLYFDLATITEGESAEGLKEDARFIRQIGVNRILYGTDTSPPNPPARVSWASIRSLVPLTDEEFRSIADNIAPYLQ